ncbi:MAG TPA: MFS transporter [Anaerolineales bacterium]|nr:MFS transporter [Anaerolineales bacterium]
METTPTTSNIPEKWAPRFFTMWTGQAFSLVGSSVVQFALVWWMTRTTGSATVLATATLLGMLPQIFLGPFAGALIDRWNRKAVMMVADSLIALATVVLIFLFATHHESLLAVYIILVLRSAGGAFHYPAMQSSTSLMVPKSQLARIAGINQTLNGVINIISPPIGALLIALLPMPGVLAIDVATAFLAVSILAFVRVPQPPRQLAQAAGTVQKTGYWQDLGEGWRYLVAWPGLLAICLLAMLINFLLTPAGALIPLVVTRVYHGGATQLGLVDSLSGIGVIIGGLVLSAWGGFKRRIATTLMGIIGLGVGILLFGLLPANLFSLALAGAFLFGSMQVMANGPLSAIFQSTIDPDMQGRVMSLTGAGATAMAPLGLLVAGPISDWLGVRTWYLIGGVACVLVTLIAFSIPVIMNIEQNAKKTSPPDSTVVA